MTGGILPRSSQYHTNFDGLRGFAAMLVLLLHGGYSYLTGGWVGVDLFFVLSGFLITSLLRNELDATGTISFRKFYIRRALRLIPALIAGIILANLLWSFTSGHSMENGNRVHSTLAGILYCSNLLAGNTLGNLAHLWSLAVEEHFYIFWPLVMLPLLRIRKLEYQVFILVVIIVLVFFSRLYVFFNPVEVPGIFTLDPYTFTLFRVDGIIIGAVLALVAAKTKCAQPDPGNKWLYNLVFLLLLIGYGYILFFYSKNDIYFKGRIWLVNFLCVATVFAALKSPVHFILSGKVARWIGKRSYGIYVYHFPIFLVLENFRIAGDNLNLGWVTLLRFGLTFLFAGISYEFLEKPFLRLKIKYG